MSTLNASSFAHESDAVPVYMTNFGFCRSSVASGICAAARGPAYKAPLNSCGRLCSGPNYLFVHTPTSALFL
jgi:hypothetical protein